MSLPILIAALFPVFLAPFWTHHLYQTLYHRVEAHIAVDNAGVVLGQKDRDLFNRVMLSNRLSSVLEGVHHPLHRWARLPVVGVYFVAEDVAYEASIQGLHASAYANAQREWLQSRQSALKELTLLHTRLWEMDRNSLVPLTGKKCKLCGLEAHWEVERTPVETHIKVDSNEPRPELNVRLEGKTLLGGGKWNYRLFLQKGGD